MISDHDVRVIVNLIDASHAADILEDALRTDKRGQKRRCSARTFLVGTLLASRHNGGLNITTIHQTLTTDISRPMQHKLDILRRRGDRITTLSYGNVATINKLLGEKLDHTVEAAPDLTEEERTRRAGLLRRFCDSLLDITLIEATSTFRAIDSTGIWAWAIAPRRPRNIDELDGTPPQNTDEQEWRDTRKQAPSSNDPDARWGMKTRKDGKQQGYFGYELHASVRVPDRGDDSPIQVERIAVTPANGELTAATLGLFDRARAAGHTITDILGDRHYSYKRTETWADELRQRGINQHLDMRSDDHGYRDLNGIKVVAGRGHCPAAPNRLGHIPHPGLGATRQQMTDFEEAIAEREAYAMRRVERPNETGRTRLECPALSGTVGCPLRPGTVPVADQLGLPVVVNPPDADTAPKCCTQRTVSVTEAKLNKYDQPHYWGSPKWRATYARRTYVEGIFGSMKDPNTENVSRGFIRTTGQARMTIYLAIATAATNMRHLQVWHARTGKGPVDHPALEPAPPSHGFIELDEEQARILDLTLAEKQVA